RLAARPRGRRRDRAAAREPLASARGAPVRAAAVRAPPAPRPRAGVGRHRARLPGGPGAPGLWGRPGAVRALARLAPARLAARAARRGGLRDAARLPQAVARLPA